MKIYQYVSADTRGIKKVDMEDAPCELSYLCMHTFTHEYLQ